jgi:hypothetical protein
MRYRGKRPSGGLTAGQVVAIAIIGLAAILILTTAAGARMMHTDPLQDFVFCMTYEADT